MKGFVSLFLLLVVSQAVAQELVNQKAPDIHVDRWMNPEDRTPQTAEQWIVLDFWFTTCAPCVFTLPHLNDLAKTFKRQDVTFLAITFEQAKQVNKFLKARKMEAHIGLDTAYQTIKAFGVQGYPETFVIDPEGIVRWQGYPLDLNAPLLADLMGSTQLPENVGNLSSSSGLKKEVTDETIYPIEVSQNSYMGPVAKGYQQTKKEMTVTNYTLKEVMATLLDQGESRVLSSDTTRYDIRFMIPRKLKKKQIPAEIAKSLLHELDYTAKIKREIIDGFALSLENDSLLNANAVQSRLLVVGKGKAVRYGNWEGEGVEMKDLIVVLENEFDMIIRDATDYNPLMNLTFTLSDFEQAQEELKAKYGLVLIPQQFEVDLMKIEKQE